MPPKRKQVVDENRGPVTSSAKRAKKANSETVAPPVPPKPWPSEFHELFKIFKTLNTVLAFCSSRKSLATTFPVVRSSVEALLKKPLDLEKVAELKALLPDIIKFAYIPKAEHTVNESVSSRKDKDLNHAFGDNPVLDGEEHVLILEFMETKKKGGQKTERELNPTTFQMPPGLSTKETQKLIIKRNERFEVSVNELLNAITDDDDPIELLKAAAKEHIPINPDNLSKIASSEILKPEDPKLVPSPQDRPTIESIINELKGADWYKGQIEAHQIFEPRQPQPAVMRNPFSNAIMQAMHSTRGITSLYTHQAEAIDAILEANHVIVCTSTASGKSIIYQAPLLTFLERDRDMTAMFIYPTKALAQDQKTSLQSLLFACSGLDDIEVYTHDGDTPKECRAAIRENASVVFTNFDSIHASILPHENLWRRFLKNLTLVVVDELHYYSSVFGSHVAQIMRRLRRICAALGNRRLQFVSCSATIAEPAQHMQDIFGLDSVQVIDNDGAPSGRKDFIIWNSPLIDELERSMGRENPIRQASMLMRYLMKRGVRTILFCKVRKMCELAMKTIRTELTSEGRLDILEKVAAYRGGYSQDDRRRIEREAFGGRLLGIVATNALELGVDIGVLDAVIMLGFPFSIANLRQQSGRAGRRAKDALTALICSNDSIDQHYVQNPLELFTRAPDPLLIHVDSEVILEAHLQCAALEMPLSDEDERYFGANFKRLCKEKLVQDAQGWYHTHPRLLPFPTQHVNIRGVREEYYTILDVTRVGASKEGGARILEEIEYHRALFETYEGGVFLHQGQTYVVQEVSHDTKVVKIIRADVSWTTKPRDFTNVDALQTSRIREIRGSKSRAFYGRVEITTIIFGFFKLRHNQILDAVSLDTPPFTRESTGWWIDIPQEVLEIMRRHGFNVAEAIHSAAHAILNQFDMQKDLKTECKVALKEYRPDPSRRKRPARLMFFDAAGKSGGVAGNAFDHSSVLVHGGFETIESCKCQNGCNLCIFSGWCKEGNAVNSKLGAQVLLRGILGLPIDPNALPQPVEPYDSNMDTIVDAVAVPTTSDVQVELL